MSRPITRAGHLGTFVAVLALAVAVHTRSAAAADPCFIDQDGHPHCAVQQPGVPDSGGLGQGSGGGESPQCVWMPVLEGDAPQVVRTRPDGTVERLMRNSCTAFGAQWFRVGGPALVVRPGDLVPGLRDEIVAGLPRPVPRVAPADDQPGGLTFTQLPTFFWVDQRPGQWAPITRTARVPTLSVAMTASPERFVVDPGDGSPVVRCAGVPPAFPKGADPDTFQGCRLVFHHSSTMSVNGLTWPVRVSIEWHIRWTATNGETGDLGVLPTTTTKDLPVGEIEALVTGVGR